MYKYKYVFLYKQTNSKLFYIYFLYYILNSKLNKIF